MFSFHAMPSELVQAVAQHLQDNWHYIIEIEYGGTPIGLDVDKVAKLIQEYYDGLL